MCGICGIYNYKTSQPADAELLERMTQVVAHRGPDDQGLWCDGSVGIGMRRLSIIDLSTGHQPLSNEDGTIWIVFNGEIYNYLDLRKELIANGHVFQTQSDTEVVVHAYEMWGDDCTLRLNGIFGFAIWDQRRQRLFLARDHYGVKPLYYFDDGKRLLFGSEIKSILEDSSVPRQVDLNALDLFLTFRFVPSPATMFQGIHKLPPGHRLIVEPDGIFLQRYWDPRPQVDENLSEADYIFLLQERLEAAVRRQMISDVPLGALLSGGIDSSVVVAIMSQASSERVKTFTVGFTDGDDVNELNEARYAAQLFGTDHHEVVIGSLDYEELLAKSIWHLDEPISTTSALAMFFVCKLAREHLKVVLTGQGADEPFAGYHRYLGERYGALYRMIPDVARRSLIRPVVERLPRMERWKRAVRSLDVGDTDGRFVDVYTVFPNDLRQRLWAEHLDRTVGSRTAADVVNYWRYGVSNLDTLSQMTYVDARLSLADDLLLYGDKMSMATSIEARVPFLDLGFMEIAEALPGRLRIRGTTRKYLHKKVVAKWLPDEIINRRKRGFETPIDRWFQGELTGYISNLLLGQHSAVANYFASETIQEMITAHAGRHQDYQRQLFSLLSFEIWHRTFINQEPF